MQRAINSLCMNRTFIGLFCINQKKKFVCILDLPDRFTKEKVYFRLVQAEDSASALERLLHSSQQTLANPMTRDALMLTGLLLRASAAFDVGPIFAGRTFHMHADFRNKGKRNTKTEGITLVAAINLVPVARL